MQPGEQVDEVRISAGDGSTAGTREVANYPVEVSGGNGPATTVAPPEWVTRLNREDKAAQDAAYKKAMNQPFSAGDVALFAGFMFLMPAVGIFGILAPTWGLWRWRGGWRVAAAVPAALTAFVILRLAVGVAHDPTSHNLWPFEILQAGGLSVIIMLVLLIARKIAGVRRAA